MILIKRAIKGESLPDFYHNPAEGTLSYGRHKIRNVAMRLTTVYGLIDGLRDLEGRGDRIGRSFANDFRNELNLESRSLSNQDKLTRWANYDSVAGWGKISFELAPNFAGRIRIKNCFLCSTREDRNTNYCGFMEGYIKGTIHTLFGKDVIVRLRNTDTDNYCNFEVRSI